MRRARRWTTWRVLRATLAESSTSRKPGRSSTWANSVSQARPSRALRDDPGMGAAPGRSPAPGPGPGTRESSGVMPLQLVQRLLLGPAPLVGGPQVVDRKLSQADPERRGVREAAIGVGPQGSGGPGVAPQLRTVLAVRVDEQEPVTAVGCHHSGCEHSQEVGLAHSRRRKDPDVAGQAAARDADREVHDCLTAAEAPDRDVAHSPGQESEVFRGGRHDPRELGRQALRLPEHGPGAARGRLGGPGTQGTGIPPAGRSFSLAHVRGEHPCRLLRRLPGGCPRLARPSQAPGARSRN